MTEPTFERLIARLGVVDSWPAADGWPLRRFTLPPPEDAGPRGSILFLGGRGDIFEKYFETFARWHHAGWFVSSFDWRGQGGSGRLGRDARVGHLDDFAPLIADLAAFWNAWRAERPGPHVLIGHSMGGFLALRAMVEDVVSPDAAVLIAPMLGLHGAPLGLTLSVALARAMVRIGPPDRAAWKANEKPVTLSTRQRLLTHDDARYAQELAAKRNDPAIAVGPPSWAWVNAAFEATRALDRDPRLSHMAVPTLILSADADRLVAAPAARRVAARLRDARLIRFGSESAHEILREADRVRDRALAEIDLFLDARAPAASEPPLSRHA